MKAFKRLTVLGTAVALVAVACGGGTSIDPDAAAIAPHPASACEAGAADCDDAAGPSDEPLFIEDEPDLGVDPGTSSGFVIGGGLTVEKALQTDATGVIAVQGFVVQDQSGIRLCDLLAESLPPLCGGESVAVADLGTVDPDELKTAQGVTWTDQPVTILGEIIDNVLVPTPFSL